MFRERKDLERGKDGALNKVRRAYKTRTKKRGPLQINSFYGRRGKSKKDTYFYCTIYMDIYQIKIQVPIVVSTP
jgi:hypothetical protein